MCAENSRFQLENITNTDAFKLAEKLSKGFLIILTGLPASGKSLFSQKLLAYLEPVIDEVFKKKDENECVLKKPLVHIIDIDEVRVCLFGPKFNPEFENDTRKSAIERVEKFINLNDIVIVDDINYYTSMRHEFVEIAQNNNVPYYIIYLETPYEVCIEWDKNRANPIGEVEIDNIAYKFDLPGKKYAWDKPFFVLDPSDPKINMDDEIQKLTQKILLNLLQYSSEDNKEKEIRTTRANVEQINKDYMEYGHGATTKLEKSPLKYALNRVENTIEDFLRKFLGIIIDSMVKVNNILKDESALAKKIMGFVEDSDFNGFETYLDQITDILSINENLSHIIRKFGASDKDKEGADEEEHEEEHEKEHEEEHEEEHEKENKLKSLVYNIIFRIFVKFGLMNKHPSLKEEPDHTQPFSPPINLDIKKITKYLSKKKRKFIDTIKPDINKMKELNIEIENILNDKSVSNSFLKYIRFIDRDNPIQFELDWVEFINDFLKYI
ncbi:MAG: AAA family ATPase [Promethearchaeota archaeon]